MEASAHTCYIQPDPTLALLCRQGLLESPQLRAMLGNAQHVFLPVPKALAGSGDSLLNEMDKAAALEKLTL